MLPDSLQHHPVAYEGVRFKVRRVELDRRDGGKQRREVVEPADAVLVVPVLDDGRVVMIRNERFAVGKTLWELPAGTLEPSENPDDCAPRECEEETGYAPRKCEKLVTFFTCPGFCTELMHVYLATGLKHVGQSLDETEKIEVFPMTLDKAMTLVKNGEVQDAKTLAGLLFYAAFVRDGKGRA